MAAFLIAPLSCVQMSIWIWTTESNGISMLKVSKCNMHLKLLQDQKVGDLKTFFINFSSSELLRPLLFLNRLLNAQHLQLGSDSQKQLLFQIRKKSWHRIAEFFPTQHPTKKLWPTLPG